MTESSKPDRIDEIFAQIEARESALKEKYLLTICGSILVLFFIMMSSFILTRSSEPLNIRKEQDHAAKGLMVEEISSTTSFVEEDKGFDKLNLSPIEEKELAALEANEQVIKLEIKGEQVAVSELTFQIVNFDPEFVYRADFGNGEGKRVEETFSYNYLEPGVFALKVIAYGKNNSKKKLVKKLNIKP